MFKSFVHRCCSIIVFFTLGWPRSSLGTVSEFPERQSMQAHQILWPTASKERQESQQQPYIYIGDHIWAAPSLLWGSICANIMPVPPPYRPGSLCTQALVLDLFLLLSAHFGFAWRHRWTRQQRLQQLRGRCLRRPNRLQLLNSEGLGAWTSWCLKSRHTFSIF